MVTYTRCGFVAVVLTAIALVMSPANAGIRLGAHGGLSWLLDEGADDFQTGFTVGASAFQPLVPYVELGLRAAYNRWAVEEDEVINELEEVLDGDVDGAAHMVEIIPSARITSPFGFPPFSPFVQAGVGVYIRSEQVSVEGTGPLGDLIEKEPFDDTEARLGFQAGPGVSLKLVRIVGIEVLGLYNLLFEEGDRSQYITLNAGVTLALL